MKQVLRALKNFFLPPENAPRWVRLLPYAVLGVLTLLVLTASAYAWEYTNSPEFCGTVCHTMPPEYTTYLTSPHARVDCVECHIGRGFIATRITRKAGDVKHIIATAFKTYEFPIRAHDLRPARETCEKCHFPEKFSDDSLREIRTFESDTQNTPLSIYLTLKTGGGSERLGLGRGIHWHIENEVRYLALDLEEQEIPYIEVMKDDGSIEKYIDIVSDIEAGGMDPDSLMRMDCITCHNRITHLIYPPQDALDRLLSRGIISPDIPEIKRLGVDVLSTSYESERNAMEGIQAMADFYQEYYPEFYATQKALVDQAIAAIQDVYSKSVFPDQSASWESHPNNIGHQDSPGCFRCHDGKHLNAQNEAIRLECNLCHSIPVVAGPSDFVTEIEISRGPEPQSHLNPNWIRLHHEVFDDSCANCHTTKDPGGTSDNSFCSNSACHGSVYQFAGFDAPALREVLQDQVPTPEPLPTPADGELTFDGTIGPLFQARCGNCHGVDGLQGLNLTTYESVFRGGESGPAVLPGDPQGSLLIQKQTSEQPHFSQLTDQELDWVRTWIEAGAPE
jgi:nitrate/TMAO reductase-like tetraheme cytochrome c subunit/mono/diheme cytochrome c family protein